MGMVLVSHTGLDDVYPDVVEAGVDLLPQERRRHRVDVVDAQGVLGRQRRRRRHGVAPVGGDDLLVRLEAAGEVSHVSVSEPWPVDPWGHGWVPRFGGGGGGMRMTYAPPEQSEPAITSNRPWTMLAGGEVLEGAPGASKTTFTCWVSISCEVLRGTT